MFQEIVCGLEGRIYYQIPRGGRSYENSLARPHAQTLAKQFIDSSFKTRYDSSHARARSQGHDSRSLVFMLPGLWALPVCDVGADPVEDEGLRETLRGGRTKLAYTYIYIFLFYFFNIVYCLYWLRWEDHLEPHSC